MLRRTRGARLLSLALAAGLCVGGATRVLGQCAAPQFIQGSDTSERDDFGGGIAVEGDLAVISAPNEGNEGSFYGEGKAYVFRRVNDEWMEVAILLPSDLGFDDEFGARVAISGGVIFVSAPMHASNSGKAYLFVEPESGWESAVGPVSETASLTASDGVAEDIFGVSIAVDEDHAAVGAINRDSSRGAVYVFEAPPGGWATLTGDSQEAVILTLPVQQSGDRFGTGVALEGDVIIAGSDEGTYGGTGAAYVFVKPQTAGGWADAVDMAATLVPAGLSANDRFGWSCSISGDTVVVSAFFHDSAGPDSGAVYVFEMPAGGWSGAIAPVAKLTASDPDSASWLGAAVAIDLTGTVVAGAPESLVEGVSAGAVYVFEPFASGWADATETYKLLSPNGVSNGRFGVFVDIDDTTILVGAVKEDVNWAGAAYAFSCETATLRLEQIPGQEIVRVLLTSNEPTKGGQFGFTFDAGVVEILAVTAGADLPVSADRIIQHITSAGAAACAPGEAESGVVTMGWVNSQASEVLLPAGVDQEILRIRLGPAGGAAPGGCSVLSFLECLGPEGAPIRCVIVDQADAELPASTVDGEVCLSYFERGDANNDGNVSIADPIFTFTYLFVSGAAPACRDAADSTDDGSINLTDGVYTLNFLFAGGTPPPPPFPGCGTDSTEDGLDCGDSTDC